MGVNILTLQSSILSGDTNAVDRVQTIFSTLSNSTNQSSNTPVIHIKTRLDDLFDSSTHIINHHSLITSMVSAQTTISVIENTPYNESGSKFEKLNPNFGNIKCSEISSDTNSITFPSSLSITNNIESTSTSTGALVVNGGIGVTKNVNIGGTLEVNGSVTFNSSLTSGDLTFSSALNKYQPIQSQGSNTSYSNVSVSIYDLLSKIRAMDQALTLLLKNVNISSSLSSGNPFYAGAGYTGNNNATNLDSLSYTS